MVHCVYAHRTENRFLIITSIISGMLLCCKKFAGPLVGAPFCGVPCSAEQAEHA